jgi:hypothetical protein
MNALDARHGFRAQAFEQLLGGALNLLFRRFKVVEDRPGTGAESLSTMTAAEGKDWLTVPKCVAAVIN